MGLLAMLLPAGPPPTPDGHAQSMIQAALPGGHSRPEQTPQQVLDEVHHRSAGSVGQVFDKANTIRETVTEAVPAVSWEVERVTAYIDEYVHIPWLHGDQSVSSHG